MSVKQPDNELLGDEELRKKLADFLRYGLLNDGTINPNTVNTLERFVNSQKQAAIIDYAIKYKETLQEMDAERQRNSNHA